MRYPVEGYVLVMVVTFGFLLNLFLLLTLVIKRKLNEPQFLLYTVLSFWNLIEITLVIVPLITTLYSGRWIYSNAFCTIKVIMYITCFFITYVIMLLIVIDRYIFIKQPLHFNNSKTLTRVKLTLLFVSLVTVIFVPIITLLHTRNNLATTFIVQVCTPEFKSGALSRVYGVLLILFVSMPTLIECHIAKQTLQVVLYHMKHDALTICHKIPRKSPLHLLLCRHHRIARAALIIFILTISNSVILLPFSLYTGYHQVVAKAGLDEATYNTVVLLMFMDVVLNPLMCITINTRLRALISSIGRIGPVVTDVSVTSSVYCRRKTPTSSVSQIHNTSSVETVVVNSISS